MLCVVLLVVGTLLAASQVGRAGAQDAARAGGGSIAGAASDAGAHRATLGEALALLGLAAVVNTLSGMIASAGRWAGRKQ